jgi:hypothetical protein
MNSDKLNQLITEALAIEEEEAKQAGALGYMARILVQATLPHSDPKDYKFERTNGKFNLAMVAHPKLGLPYGTYPRLLLTWIVTEAVRTKESTLTLGSSLSQFMSKLSLIPTGGRWGSITRLREQMRRLLSSYVSCIYEGKPEYSGINFNIAREYYLWWDPKQPAQSDLWESTVTLGQDFFNEIITRPVPIDMRVIKMLKNSSMALDLYCWLTYRFSYLKKKTEIPWGLLQNQFGSNYADTKQGRYEFKRKLINQLKKVMLVYEGAGGVNIADDNMILIPSRSHIKSIK